MNRFQDVLWKVGSGVAERWGDFRADTQEGRVTGDKRRAGDGRVRKLETVDSI